MSLVNVCISGNRALVAVDTMLHVDNEHREGSKLFALPHAPAVMAFRGDGVFFARFVAAILGCAFPTFDAIALGLDYPLREAFSVHRAVSEATGQTSGGLELALVGWSTRESRMMAHMWDCDKATGGIQEHRDLPWMLLPDGGWKTVPSPPDTAEKMIALAHDQIQRMRVEESTLRGRGDTSPLAYGGRLILAELTMDSVTIRPIAQLGRHQR